VQPEREEERQRQVQPLLAEPPQPDEVAQRQPRRAWAGRQSQAAGPPARQLDDAPEWRASHRQAWTPSTDQPFA
jgi:hypothetical protein